MDPPFKPFRKEKKNAESGERTGPKISANGRLHTCFVCVVPFRVLKKVNAKGPFRRISIPKEILIPKSILYLRKLAW